MLTRIEHVGNVIPDVHAGVPLVVFRRTTEEDEIECMIWDIIEEEGGEVPPRQEPVR